MADKTIVFLNSKIGRTGGLEKYTKTLSYFFQDRGFDSKILTVQADKSQKQENIIELGKKSSISFINLLRFDRQVQKYVKALKPTIVFGLDRNSVAQDFYRAGNGVHAAYLDIRCKTASLFRRIGFRINPLHQIMLHMEKKTFESPYLKKLFTNSHMVKNQVLTYYPAINPENISVVHNGVEWLQWQNAFNDAMENRDSKLLSLNLVKDKYHFLFIGNDYRRKGLEPLLIALSRLKGDWSLSVVGRGKDQAYFEQRASMLNIRENVHFFGERQSLPFYQSHDCLVIPSYYDPFANVTIEALAMGLYVVSSIYNGGSEIIREKYQGATFDPYNVEELHDKLEKAMTQYPKKRIQAEKVRLSVQEYDFSKKVTEIVNQCLAFYE